MSYRYLPLGHLVRLCPVEVAVPSGGMSLFHKCDRAPPSPVDIDDFPYDDGDDNDTNKSHAWTEEDNMTTFLIIFSINAKLRVCHTRDKETSRHWEQSLRLDKEGLSDPGEISV